MVARSLVLTLLVLLPHSPREHDVRSRLDAIAQQAESAAAHHGVPLALLIATGWTETHLGTDPYEGGNWGAPADRRHRGIAGTPDDAARALASGYRVCRTWLGAVSRFRCGLCRCPHLLGSQPAGIVRLAGRIERAMAQPAGTSTTPR